MPLEMTWTETDTPAAEHTRPQYLLTVTEIPHECPHCIETWGGFMLPCAEECGDYLILELKDFNLTPGAMDAPINTVLMGLIWVCEDCRDDDEDAES